jgi:uncharacterized membrane protein YfcA
MSEDEALGDAHARRRTVRFRHALVWLLVGSLVYAVALAIVMLLYPDPKDALAPVIGPSLYLTPFFGLPYLIASARQRGWGRRLVYFTVALTLAHMAANYLAWRHGVLDFPLEPDARQYARDLATGAIGGFAGAVLAFAALLALRMAPTNAATRSIAVLGVAALTGLAALGMAHGLAWSNALELPLQSSRFVFWYECVHLPWQAALAFFLAWLMRIGRR